MTFGHYSFAIPLLLLERERFMEKQFHPSRTLRWHKLVLMIGPALGCACLIGLLKTVTTDLPKDIYVQRSESVYSFDAGTIQTAISEGRQNIFQLEWEWDHQVGTPDVIPTRIKPLPGFSPMRWSEVDFERVVRASVELSAKEPLTDANLYGIIFRSPCEDAGIGPQRVIFDFFQVLKPETIGNLLYLLRSADVDLPTSRLNWWEGTLSEVVNQRPALDARHTPAEEALQVAESSGGKNLRAMLDNACFISGQLVSVGDMKNKWRVEYYSTAFSKNLFVVLIDSTSGEIEFVVTPAPQ